MYISGNATEGRKLYQNISNEIKSRLSTLTEAKEDSNSLYLYELFEDELNSANSLLAIIKSYEDDGFYDSEIAELNNINQNFLSK